MNRRKWLLSGVLVLAVLMLLPVARRAWAQSAIEQRFDQLDRDKDGKLTPAELPAADFFKRLDLDGNGEITKPEAARALARGALNDVLKRGNPPAGNNAAPAPPTPAEAPVRQGPQPLRPGDHGIGRYVPDLTFTDRAGQAHTLNEIAHERLAVFAMTSTSCPLSKKYLPTLVELAQASGDKIAWVIVNPMATDEPDAMAAAAASFKGKAVYVHDQKGALALHLGALTTTDVVVLDRAKTIAYHGAIDDQYGFGYSIDAPRHRYLAEALAALQAGKQPLVAATAAPGCTLEEPTATADASMAPTYHNRISRLVQRHCTECHRDGGVAPFALDTYADLSDHASMVREVLERGIMPPWFAAPLTAEGKANAAHTPWANDRSLAEAEKRDMLAWIAAGKPMGDPADAPLPQQFASGWLIGEPDAVYEFAKPVPIKATGTMPYQNILVETDVSEDKWVQAIEVQPGDRAVVHHVLVFAHGSGEEVDTNDQSEGTGGFWAIYVPGNSTLVYPEGFAKRLPKGAKLRFQMHYTPSGTATTDRTRIGLIWAKQPPQHEVRVAGIVNARISIPPGADNHREEAVLRLPFDATIMGYLPHMHLRGKACKYELTRSNGATTTLLDIPRYDFNWQLLYRYFEYLPLKAGDSMRFTAWYDNSAKNPANPDPNKTVRWGAQTFDEMHLGYIEYFVPGAQPGEPSPMVGRRAGRGGGAGGGLDIDAAFRRLDRDRNGKLEGDEIPAAQRANLLRLDTDGDGALTLDEARKLR